MVTLHKIKIYIEVGILCYHYINNALLVKIVLKFGKGKKYEAFYLFEINKNN